ncbi:MAG: Lrp/AsnC ligand binding domain-containing protein, partial [Proteobacteria bacterium]|nr:Lrp/AsnC ligand binding domain-containing protein [Pseudomonadota bacterium]
MMSTKAVVLVKAQTDQISALAQSIANIAGVSDVYSVAGQYDLVAIVEVRDNEQLAEVVSDRIRKLHGI